MKKGELRREEILRTAERLFLERGYEATSIQDLLDELSISKGGFYHYFDAKSTLLRELCHQRIDTELASFRTELGSNRLEPVQKMDRLLGALFVIDRSEPRFCALLLKVCYIDGDVQLRDELRSYTLELLLPLMQNVVAEGMRNGSLFSRYPAQLAEILLHLGCDINDALCRLLANRFEQPECEIEIMEQLDAYREAVELISGAGFGRISLFRLEHFSKALRQTANELISMKGNMPT